MGANHKVFNPVMSSVFRKIVMSLTGLFLCLFLVVHLSGNFLLFKNDGGVAFNEYSKFMASNPLIRLNEILLVLGFLVHILDGVGLAIKNRQARPVGYNVCRASENSSWVSRHMPQTGVIVFVFLVIHLRSFFFPHRVLHVQETMYDTVVRAFSNPVYSVFYVLAMILLGWHLKHGFQSAFQSLGLNHPKYTPWIQRLGFLFSIIVPAGFASMPIYFYFKHQLVG